MSAGCPARIRQYWFVSESGRGQSRPSVSETEQRITAVLDATEAYALGTDRIDELTSTRIAQLSNVSVGWLYKHIGDRQAVVDAIVIRHLRAIQELIRMTRVDLERDSWPEAMALMVDAVFNYARAHRGFIRLFYSQLMDPRTSRLNFEFDQQSAREFRLDSAISDPTVRAAAAELAVGIVDKGLELAFRHDELATTTVQEQTKVAAIAYLASVRSNADRVDTASAAV